MPLGSTATGSFLNPSNRFGMDYRAEAANFAPLPCPIVDAHSHVHGAGASKLLAESMDLYGIGRIWSMTRLEEIPVVREVLGDRVEFIAVPDFSSPDRIAAHGRQFLERIPRFHAEGARLCKFWAAPRGIDFGIEAGDPALLRLDAPHRRACMDCAAGLGMALMAHIADPDTWFATRYADASKYGTKRSHYEPLERLLDEYRVPWMVAHMGGFPEDLDFLDGLLTRHPNLHLDASATKWMVREISRHEPARILAFLRRWNGRIFFGSDIVTSEEHLRAGDKKNEMAAKASDQESAFDLYASRYWALRALWETDYRGESPIGDPDLKMVDPRRDANDAPPLRGMALPPDLLRSFYTDAATAFLASLAGAPARAGSPASSAAR
ncbi:MAG: amidohydrolase family protein [Phycisphaerales bacterium]